MRRFILASHAYMSKGIKTSLELILGKQDNLSVYCAYAEVVHMLRASLSLSLW